MRYSHSVYIYVIAGGFFTNSRCLPYTSTSKISNLKYMTRSLILLFFFLPHLSFCQTKVSIDTINNASTYNLQDSINGIYIPKDIKDCFIHLDEFCSSVDKKELKRINTREERLKYYAVLGMVLKLNWGLTDGSRLQQYFNQKGVVRPDKMTKFIIDFYHDWLNKNHTAWKAWAK